MEILNMFKKRFDNIDKAMVKELHDLLSNIRNHKIDYLFRITLDDNRHFNINKIFIDENDNVIISHDVRWNDDEYFDFKSEFSIFEKRRIFDMLNFGYKEKMLKIDYI